ncbi:hypothetical protein AB6A40_003772 [Gnathostoma spinigerum]|uniref:[histone H4]-lysine(20) N-methyltransferase n=1 Tax=Gnathostoma spinigerum TaxID=75299 RepID=A0ABD6EAI5_9BILA
MLGTVVQQKRGRRRKQKAVFPKKAAAHENDTSSRKITEFFPVRRSNRKTSKQLEAEQNELLRQAIKTGRNEDYLDVYVCDVKGRGIRAGRAFRKNEFVVEYKGEIIDLQTAKLREKMYAENENIGSYMYFFKHNNKSFCVDATVETPYKGRLINHSALCPNLKTKVVEFGCEHHLILVAKRDIEIGEELLYDYGDRTPATVLANPWLVSS